MNNANFLPHSRLCSRRLLKAVSIICLGLLSACEPKPIPLTAQEKLHMNSLTQPITTRCLGRFLVDLPTSFVLSPVQKIVIEGVEIELTPMPQTQFTDLLNRRKLELDKAQLFGKIRYPALHETHAIAGDDGIGLIFDRTEDEVSGSRAARTLELHAWKNGYAVMATINATDTRFPEHINDKGIQELGTDTPEKLAHLLALYKRTEGRADTDAPNGQGVCFPNGMVRGAATDQENLQINYRMTGTPDVSISFTSLSDIREKTDLLDRSADIQSWLKEKHGYAIRKGKVNGQLNSAQEWLMGFKEPNEVARQSFTLEANSKTGSAQAPVVVFDLDAGARFAEPYPLSEEVQERLRTPLTKTTINESEAIALWDLIAPTLRLRPGAL